MKPQKSALDFYLPASPITQSGHQRSRWTEKVESACHPWAINKAGALKHAQPQPSELTWRVFNRGGLGLAPAAGAASWPHLCKAREMLVQEELCSGLNAYFLPPIQWGKYQHSTAAWAVITEMTGFKSMEQCPQSWHPDFFSFFKSSPSEGTYFTSRLFGHCWEAGELGALFHLAERNPRQNIGFQHLLSFRTTQRKHYTCE